MSWCLVLNLYFEDSQIRDDRRSPHQKKQSVCGRDTETLDITSWVVQETKCDIRVGQERAGGSAKRSGVNPRKHSCKSSLDQFGNFSNIYQYFTFWQPAPIIIYLRLQDRVSGLAEQKKVRISGSSATDAAGAIWRPMKGVGMEMSQWN